MFYSNKKFMYGKGLFALIIATGILFISCKNPSTSALDGAEMDTINNNSPDLVTTTSSTTSSTTTQANVYISNNTIDTWDPIFPSVKDSNWPTTVCYQGNSFGINANWTNKHKATQFAKNTHPWEDNNGYSWEAYWINAWGNIDSDNNDTFPMDHNWTKYETEVSGDGDFVVQLLADNCSWIYLDNSLIGFQGTGDEDDPNAGKYGVALDGTHTLTFVIFDGGGSAGGKFRLETTESFGGTVDPIKPETITLTGLIRDFNDSHPDFEKGVIQPDEGIVKSILGSDDKPVYTGSAGNPTTSNATNFNQWYNDVAGVNMSTTYDFVMELQSDGTYKYSNGAYFPIDGKLFGNQGRKNNFHFTTEIHTNFTYQGGEIFTFRGDDDVWVFINNELVIDLGGVYPARSGSVALDDLGLTQRDTYSLDIFQAERQTAGSTFSFTTNIQLVTEVPVLNTPPVANAGSDINKSATGQTTPVTLDGSNSSDPDGDTITYSWTLNGSEVSTAASFSTDLPDGSYTYTLTVSDGALTASDDVTVTIVNTVPSANAGVDITKDATGQTTPVDLDGSGSSDADSDSLSYSWTIEGNEVATGKTATISLADGDYVVTLTVSDGQGGTDTDQVNVSVMNTVPVADAGTDRTIEATGPTTPVTLQGSATDADGDSPLTFVWSDGSTGATPTVNLGVGTHTFTLTVSDPQGAEGTDFVTITIEDTTAPELLFTQATNSLWPPNHKMVLVLTGIKASDIVDGATAVDITVTSNESDNGKGDGNTTGDYEIVNNPDGTLSVYLRSERSGKGKGRTYTVTMSSTDVAGNTASESLDFSVAKSQGNAGRGR